MEREHLEVLLDACGLERGRAPDEDAWRGFLDALARDGFEEEALRRRERYLEAVVSMQRELLLTRGDELGALNPALEPLGQAAGASRVYLFENHPGPDGELLMSQRAEWCAPGIEPELDNPQLQDLSYDDFFPRWAEQMRQGELVRGIVEEFPDSEREILEPQQILSILVIPFEVAGVFTGFIGFDNCVEARAWDDLEVNLLSVAASHIGMTLDQRRSRRQLIELNEQLVEARDQALEASEAKSTFLAKVSHELRTPLNAVIGYSEFLLEELEELGHPQWSEDIGRILSSGRHLLSVINDLLDVSRAEVGALMLMPGIIDVEELIGEVAASVERLGRRNDNTFELVLHGHLGQLRTDETRVRQILLNLLSNAFKYTSGGEVTLEVEGLVDAVVFTVDDDGIGMNQAQLERIFDAFTQADDSPTRAFDGTGLGLAITHHLCELLGAHIAVTSEPGQGSRFMVTLPREMPEGAPTDEGTSELAAGA